MKDSKSPWLLEAVAGIVEPGENTEKVIIREAKEEAGIDVLELAPICHYWVSPGGCTEGVHLFCGRVDASHAGGIHGLDTEAEDIKVHVYDAQEAFSLVRQGIINQPPTIISLQWLELNFPNVFK